MSLGLVNYNWLVISEKGKFILRKVPKDRKLSDLKFELSYLDIMKQNLEFEIPASILNKEKNNHISFSGNYYWLYEFIEGNVRSNWAAEELKKIAKMLAEFHSVLEESKLNNKKGKSEPFLRKIILKEAEQNCKNITKKKEADKIYLAEFSELKNILNSLNIDYYNKQKQYPVHRDIGPENVLWKGKTISGIIDFDNVNLNDILLKDLAIVLQRSCINNLGKLNFRKAKYFINEYKKYRLLNKSDIELILDMISASYFDDFNYSYWLILNDPKRSKIKWIKENSNGVKWFYKNRTKMIENLS